jgi:hypothetical protein
MEEVNLFLDVRQELAVSDWPTSRE